MLTIRLQRKGRTGHAQFRLVVQDSRFHPTSGRVVAYVGNYDPHTKAAKLDGEKISDYLSKGAQPSDRVAKLLSKEGIKLPDWFQASAPKNKTVRNADKRRSTRPAGAAEPEAKVEEKVPVAEETTETADGTPVEEAKTTEVTEAPAENAETPEVEETPAVEEPAPEPEAPADLSAEASAKAEEATKPAPEPEAEKPAK